MIFDTHAAILDRLVRERLEKKLDTISNYYLPQALEGHITGGIWTYGGEDVETTVNHILAEINAVEEIHVVKSKDDWDIAAFNVILGLQVLNQEASIHQVYEQGFRHAAIALKENEFATREGLTREGRKLVNYMNSLGMVIDVTGASNELLLEVVHETEQPLVATSANCYELMPSGANLSDDQLKTIADTGGFVGITTSLKEIHPSKPSIETLVDHIDYLREKVGSSHIALGFNFNHDLKYKTPTLEGCRKPSQAIHVIDELYKRNYTSSEIEAIASTNAKRVINSILLPN